MPYTKEEVKTVRQYAARICVILDDLTPNLRSLVVACVISSFIQEVAEVRVMIAWLTEVVTRLVTEGRKKGSAQ